MRAATAREIASLIDRCIAVCSVGAEGFARSAMQVDDPDLGDVLRRYATQRALFVRELEAQVVSYRASERGTERRPEATLEERAALVGEAPPIREPRTRSLEMLRECIRRDAEAIHVYETAITGAPRDATTAGVHAVIHHQYVAIRETFIALDAYIPIPPHLRARRGA